MTIGRVKWKEWDQEKWWGREFGLGKEEIRRLKEIHESTWHIGGREGTAGDRGKPWGGKWVAHYRLPPHRDIAPSFIVCRNHKCKFVHVAICSCAEGSFVLPLNFGGWITIDLDSAWLPHSPLLTIDLGVDRGPNIYQGDLCWGNCWKLSVCVCVCVCVCVVLGTLWCPTVCDPMESPPGSSVHGVLQARILEWVTMPSSRGFSWPRDQTWVSCMAHRFFTIWAIRKLFCSMINKFLSLNLAVWGHDTWDEGAIL